MKSSDKSSLCGVLLVEHFGRDAATPVGHARGRCCLSRIHSITHQVGETVPHARYLANIRAGGWCSSRLAKLGWKSQKVDASPEARGAMTLRAEHHRARNQRLRYLASRRPAGQCGRCGSDAHERAPRNRCNKDLGLDKGSTCTPWESRLCIPQRN